MKKISLDLQTNLLFVCLQFFDRGLCVRQLRYSGMMETTKIRQAGYPIRHKYKEFVQRYRHLVPGIGPAHKVNCKDATEKICRLILGNKCDFQLGLTKVFLKDIDDVRLEQERERVFLKFILVIQRGFRRLIFKRWLERHRKAAIIIQRAWRGYASRCEYSVVKQGFLRLQACIRSRQLSYRFGLLRSSISILQAHSRGFLTRLRLKGKLKRLREISNLRITEEQEFRKAGNKNWKDDAETNYRTRLKELTGTIEENGVEENGISTPSSYKIDIDEDNKVVDAVFGFLDATSDDIGDESVSVESPPHVSDMLVYFEAKSRDKKPVPSKLLSRPVGFYTYESRL